ncbi:hypothetical protein C0J52_01700 [Blattella germanica]|nr:hypothetical protein C0J52_01700 [Blattella germanica]
MGYNDELYTIHGDTDVVKVIKSSRVRWLGLLFSEKELDPCRKVTLTKIDGKRKVGRPPKRWMDSVEHDLKTVGVYGWRRKAEDRIKNRKVKITLVLQKSNYQTRIKIPYKPDEWNIDVSMNAHVSYVTQAELRGRNFLGCDEEDDTYIAVAVVVVVVVVAAAAVVVAENDDGKTDKRKMRRKMKMMKWKLQQPVTELADAGGGQYDNTVEEDDEGTVVAFCCRGGGGADVGCCELGLWLTFS